MRQISFAPRMAASLAALLVIGIVSRAPTARADAAGVRTSAPGARSSSLSWIRLPRTEECVSTQALAQAVERRLGRAVFVSPSVADVSVEGRVERVASGFRAVVVVRDHDGKLLGTRELGVEKKPCDALDESLALVIAVMIDPDAALAPTPAPIAPPAEGAPAPPAAPPIAPTPIAPTPIAPAAIAPAPPETPARKRATWHLDGGVGLVSSLGLLPFPNVGGTIGGILTPPGFVGLEAYGAYFLDTTATADGGASTSLELLYVGGSLCPLQHHEEHIHFAACGGGQIGFMRSRGIGMDSGHDDNQIVLNVAGDAHVTIPIEGPLGLRGGGQFIVPLRRDKFDFALPNGTTTEVFRMAPVAIVAEIGVGAHFQ